jgi:HEAT repeat protein
MRHVLCSLVTTVALLAAPHATHGDELALGEQEDLAQLEEHEIGADLDGVRRFLQPPGPSEEDVRLAGLWAAQLGSEKFAEREAASQKLLAMGLDAWEAVERATKSKDAETRARARGLFQRLSKLKEQRDAALPAVLRTIVRRKMQGLTPQLLKIAPHATSYAAEDCLRRALWASVTRDDAESLREAIAKGPSAARTAAALALPAAMGEQARDALQPLLEHEDFSTRLAAAQALAPLAREASFRVLVQGLEAEELPARMKAAQVLQSLTGEHFGYAAYASPERRALAVKRWQEWMARRSAEAPLRQPLATGPLPRGRYLLCHYDPYYVSELDEASREWFRRQSPVPEDEAYCGCAVSPEGYRVLAGFGSIVAFQGAGEGMEVWRIPTPEQPATVERTPAGNYLIGLFDDQKLSEVQSNGQLVREIKLPGNPSDVRYVSPERVLVAVYSTRQIVEIDASGEIAWRIDNVPPPESARRLANGNTLITTALGKALEYDPEGREVWSYTQNIPMAYDALELPNGNVLIAFRRGLREVDRTGATVREWQTAPVRRICAY